MVIMSSGFALVQLPQTYSDEDREVLRLYASKYRTLRLDALKTNPEAFGSTYGRELVFDDTVWEQRLANPAACTFVALENTGVHAAGTGSSSTFAPNEDIVSNPWVGTLTLSGPYIHPGLYPSTSTQPFTYYMNIIRNPSAYRKPSENSIVTTTSPAVAATAEITTDLYGITGMWIHPASRGKGIAKSLINTALSTIPTVPGCSPKICIMFTEWDNHAALNTYKACGFVTMGEEKWVDDLEEGRGGVCVGMRKAL